jgi:hypothetical protein
MTSFSWARADSADAPVAVLLPGVNYTVQAPLLYWCATLLAERGWWWRNRSAPSLCPGLGVRESRGCG